METIRSGDAEIVYESLGQGPPVLLLHPFPADHTFWKPVAESLSAYRVILPDLRGHGDSGIGEGPATMSKHAEDLARVLNHASVGRVAAAGVSIGGYVLFEFLRRYPNRLGALVLCCTKASADTLDARTNRLRSAAEVLERGVQPFVESMLPKLIGKTAYAARPDLVARARRMALKMSPQGISQVQQGMAERPDSVETLKSINIASLVVAGEEDMLATRADAELMRANIAGGRLAVISQAGHFAPLEKPEEVGRLIRQFFDSSH